MYAWIDYICTGKRLDFKNERAHMMTESLTSEIELKYHSINMRVRSENVLFTLCIEFEDDSIYARH